MTAILIAEPSAPALTALVRALAELGLTTVACRNLADAREALRTTPIMAAVIADTLPDGSARDLLEDVRRDPRSASIPVLTLPRGSEPRFVVAWVRTQLARNLDATPRVVLVVDDTDVSRGKLAGALETSGWRVLAARSGSEGLRIASESHPAAIVVAGAMPGMDGPTMIRRIRLDPTLRGTPCVLLASADDPAPELSALDAGADAFVRKSADLAIILGRIANLMRTQSERDTELGASGSLLTPRRVLVVDDDSDFRHVVGEQLLEDGYQAVLAESGDEALELLAAQEVDCILLDRMMPGLSGAETCRRIKGAPGLRDIPLVMMTASDGRTEMIDGLAAGADDFIVKTSGWEVLRARVQAQLRRRRFEAARRETRELVLREAHLAAEARAARDLAATQAALAAELSLSNRRIEEANRLKSAFLAHMSHELRTPLNAIIGFSELLVDRVVPLDAPEHDEYLGDILSSGRHLLRLVNDVLDLAKVEAGKLELAPEPFDLRALLREVIAVLGGTAKAKAITLTAELDETVGAVVLDPVRVKQVAYNFLSNALKFTPTGGEVALSLCADGPDRFSIAVADTGPGIAPADLPQLFTEFNQLAAGRASPHAGTGLGLALTRRLVEAHGGTVHVTSTVGEGSTFSATLPRVLAATQGR